MAVAQHALDVTANNVANVNTTGYTRKLAQQEAVVLNGHGAGARSTAPSRAVDEFLTARIFEQQARLGRTEVLDAVQSSALDRIFGAPGDMERGLSAQISRVAATAETLAASAGAAQKQAFAMAVDELARTMATSGAEVQTLRRDADQELARTIDEINEDISALAGLNTEIVRSGPQSNLLDKRDALLENLSRSLEISVDIASSGSVSVYTRNGSPLLERTPRHLDYAPATTVTTTSSFMPIRLFRAEEIDPNTGRPEPDAVGSVLVTGGVRAELTPELGADAIADRDQRIVSPFTHGKLQGLLELRDRVLPALADQLGELAGLARHGLNAAHNAAVALPPPDRLVGTRTDFGDLAGAERGGSAYLAVVDRSSGAVAATLRIDAATLDSPEALAEQITAGLAGHAAAVVNAQGALELSAASGFGLAFSEGSSSIVAADSAGHVQRFGVSHYFGFNDLVVGAGPRPTDLKVRPDLLADPSRLGQAKLDVSTTPPLNASLGGSGDHRGASGLAEAFEQKVDAVTRGGLPGGSYRLADYAAEIAGAVAVAAEHAGGRAENDRALAEELSVRRSNLSGVNLDEELSRMMVYQQAYSVSARVMAVVDELFDQLLAIGR